jgi:hypothetical protein
MADVTGSDPVGRSRLEVIENGVPKSPMRLSRAPRASRMDIAGSLYRKVSLTDGKKFHPTPV